MLVRETYVVYGSALSAEMCGLKLMNDFGSVLWAYEQSWELSNQLMRTAPPLPHPFHGCGRTWQEKSCRIEIDSSV